MSAVALPTKPGGSRPPNYPPIGTSFDPFGSDESEPFHKVVADDVKFIIKKAQDEDADGLPLMRELLLGRKRMVESELQFERLIEFEPMPPLLSNFYTLDFLGTEGDPVATYIKLLHDLDVAIGEIDARIAALNEGAVASD